MDERGDFLPEKEFKSKLTSINLSGNELKQYLLLKFGYYKKAAQEAQISEDRLHQIFLGYAVPKSSKIINRLARAWDVDIVLLTQLFDKLRETYEPVKKFHEDFDKNILNKEKVKNGNS